MLANEVQKPYFAQLLAFVAGERKKKTIFPVPADCFGAFALCPLNEVKVVIIGQGELFLLTRALAFAPRAGALALSCSLTHARTHLSSLLCTL